jgi:hypothetical protein
MKDMKKIIFSVVLMVFAAAIVNAQAVCLPAKKGDLKTNAAGGYGVVITKDNAIPVTQLESKLNGKPLTNVKITGTVVSVCQKKGCWMEVDLGNNQTLRMHFKDYGFFVPKDASGKTFYAQGEALYDTTSVEMLRHYAQDAKKTGAEINAITKPEVAVTFVAEGVLFEEKK